MNIQLKTVIAALDAAQATILSPEDNAIVHKFIEDTRGMNAHDLVMYVGTNISTASSLVKSAILGQLCGIILSQENTINKLKSAENKTEEPDNAETNAANHGNEQELLEAGILIGTSKPTAVAVVDYFGHRTVALKHDDGDGNEYLSFVLVTKDMPEPDFVGRDAYEFDDKRLEEAWRQADMMAMTQMLSRVMRK